MKQSVVAVGSVASKLDLGLCFREGGMLLKQAPRTFVLATVFFLLLSLASISLLMGPLVAGYLFLFVRELRGEAPHATDIFHGFSRFVPLVLAFYLTKVLVAIGIAFLVIPGLILIAHFFFVELIILDQRVGVREAIRRNRQVAKKHGLWNYVILNIALGAILHLGGLLSYGVGYFIVTPFVCSVYAVAYVHAFPAGEIHCKAEHDGAYE